jgi:hypothetical protein
MTLTIKSVDKLPGGENDLKRWDRTTRYRRSTGLMVLAAAAATVLADCSGGHSTPHVARLATSTTLATNRGTSGASFATTVPKGDLTRLLSEWTACMRSHGDPNQAQPTVDPNMAIHLVEPAGYFGTIAGPTGQDSTGAGVTCLPYLNAASTALHGGEPLQAPDPAAADRFAACMRASGVSNFPDPGAGPASGGAGSALPNPNSASFEKAAKACALKVPQAASLGGPASLQAGQIEIDNADGSVRLIVVGTT